MPEIPAPTMITSSSVTVESAVEPMVRNVNRRSVQFDSGNEFPGEQGRNVDISRSQAISGLKRRGIKRYSGRRGRCSEVILWRESSSTGRKFQGNSN